MKPKSLLLRVVLTDTGAHYDASGRENGRGVYVCRDADCISRMQKARKSRFAGGGAIPDSVFAELREVTDNG